ncbi:MAG: hypothetical protein R3B68_06140 [Phycisphaerales bacterium]
MKIALGLAAVAAMAGTAFGAVVINDGAGPVAGATNTLDFDAPFVASGPVAGGVGAGQGFAGLALVGSFIPGTDVINAGSNGSGQSLVSLNNTLAVSGINEGLDGIAAGGGFEVTFSSPATAFSWLFVDQINMGYQVELFNGAASLGTATATYGGGVGSFPFPESQADAMGASFDRAVITFPNGSGGVGIDNLAYVAVPAPGTLALAAFGVLGLRRRR